jgi:hypothetical protein
MKLHSLSLLLLLGAAAPFSAGPLARSVRFSAERKVEQEARPLTASEFAGLIERISEEGGYFWNDNYVSNEASYLHPLGKLRELGIQGGVYIGVGPNQNLTYIAKLRPRYAFIIDIRRQNFLEHFLFKALFHYARNRAEYLSMLLGRPIDERRAPRDDASVDELVRHFEAAEPSTAFHHRNQGRIRLFLTRACRIGLSEQDLQILDKIHRAFFTRGLAIKYDYIPVPTYGEFLVETDLDGKKGNFLNSAQEFRYLKRLHEENRIVPVVGDFAGSRALRELGKVLRERGESVTVFYTSNVEQYLVRNQTWGQFLENVEQLPLDERSVFIRAYWSNRIPHPDGESGYNFTQVLQWARPFLKSVSQSQPASYWDIVTTDTIKLR